MFTSPIQLSEVRYNAAEQQFEAAVRVHDNGIERTYACAIPAPISTSFEDAAQGLTKQALRRHTKRGGMFSHIASPALRLHAGSRSFDPARWLEGLMQHPNSSAA